MSQPTPSIPLMPPSSPPPAPPVPPTFPEHDDQRALMFGEWLDGDFKYLFEWKQWVIWENEQWALDPTSTQELRIMQKAREWGRELVEMAAAMPPSAQQLQSMALAKRCLSADHINALIRFMKGDSAVATTDFDANSYLLGVNNGCVNLKTGEFRKAEKDDLILKRCTVDYDANAVCPMWREFQEQILPDKTIRDFVQRAFGYACSGVTIEQVLFFFYGFGQNGKSTTIEVIEKLFGPYALRMPATLFLESKSDESMDNKMAQLPEKRFVIGAEMPRDAHLAEARIKDLTGGDSIYARKLFCEPFNFHPTHKLYFYGNHRPVIRGADKGIWRRLLLVPFLQEIPEAKRDRGIVERLQTEKAGILNWMIEGAMEWSKNGLQIPEAVRAAVTEYREDEDLVGQFFEEQCEFGPTLSIPRARLSFAFECWMKSAGYKFTFSPRAISDRAARMPGVKEGTKTNGSRSWSGITLKDPAKFVGGPK